MILQPSASIELKLTNKWERCGNGLFRGHFFIDGALDNMELITSARDIDALLGLLRTTQGFFSSIIVHQDKLILIADHMRSYPIFYRIIENKILISDDPESIVDVEQDRLSIKEALEFLCIGYVTGANTLIPGLKQVEPGTCVIFRGGKAERMAYFNHRPVIEQSIDPGSYYDAFNRALQSSFQRLRAVTRGGQIALPLSGGFDSRLIALCLKKFDFENVIAFSYGRPGNMDSEISKKVAKGLGFDWFYVPYSNEMWKKVSRSKSWSEYLSYAFQLTSTPHPQDFPAIESLVNEGVIERGATITPGHRPDGAHVPEFVPDEHGMVTKEKIARNIMKLNYVLWRIEPGSVLENEFLSRLYDSFGIESAVYKNVASSISENWFLKERESKFIVNSMRCYDYFGLNWWLPLLDQEFVRFWGKTSYSCKEQECYMRSGRLFMDEVVGDHVLIDEVFRAVKGQQEKAELPDNKKISLADFGANPSIDAIKRSPFVNELIYELGYFREGDYENHNRTHFGLVRKKEFMRLYTGQETKNSFIALDLVKDLIHPEMLEPSERDLLRSIPIFKSNMLKYLERNSRAVRKHKSHPITRQTEPAQTPES